MKIQEKESQRFPWWISIIITVLLLIGLVAVWVFVLNTEEEFEESKPVTMQTAPPLMALPEPAVHPEPEPQPVTQPEPVPEPAVHPEPQPPPIVHPEPELAARQAQPVPEPVKRPEPVPEPVKQPEPEPVKQAQPVRQPEPVPVIKAPATPPAPKPQPAVRRRPPPPVASYKVPATIPRGGVTYRVRYGDTLWDIAAAFYRNPWLWPRIARYNNIRNPNLIVSGRTIRIPPKN